MDCCPSDYLDGLGITRLETSSNINHERGHETGDGKINGKRKDSRKQKENRWASDARGRERAGIYRVENS